MKPIAFSEANTVFATGQKEYLPLPAYQHKDNWKGVSSCWGLSLMERIKILFTGKVWVSMPTFGDPLTPIKLSINKPDFNDNSTQKT